MLSEIIGTFVLVFVAAAISSDNLSPNGLAPGFGPFLVGLARLGHRLVARRPDGLRDQSGARLGPAHRARAPADRGQGQLGLGLRGDPGARDRSSAPCSPGSLSSPSASSAGGARTRLCSARARGGLVLLVDELRGLVGQSRIVVDRVADAVELLRSPTALRDLRDALRFDPLPDRERLLLAFAPTSSPPRTSRRCRADRHRSIANVSSSASEHRESLPTDRRAVRSGLPEPAAQTKPAPQRARRRPT